jgi:hypothetical protein
MHMNPGFAKYRFVLGTRLMLKTFCGAIDAWNSRDYYQAVESLGRK